MGLVATQVDWLLRAQSNLLLAWLRGCCGRFVKGDCGREHADKQSRPQGADDLNLHRR